MSDGVSQRTLLTAAFEELVYAIAGVVASHSVPDGAIWDLARVVDHTHRKALAKLGDTPQTQTHSDRFDEREHPAIARLLRQLRDNVDR